MTKIIHLKLGKIGRRIRITTRRRSPTPKVVNTIPRRCTEVDTGARNVDHILNRTLLPELSAEFLAAMSEGRTVRNVAIEIDGQGGFAYRLS